MTEPEDLTPDVVAKVEAGWRAFGQSAILRSRVWQFVSEAFTGSPMPDEDDYLKAAYLAVRYVELYTELYVVKYGLSEDEARARVAAVIESRRAMYADLVERGTVNVGDSPEPDVPDFT